MDPISTSGFALNSKSQVTYEKYAEILGSTVSISSYEQKNIKSLTPQIVAAILATSYHVSLGISLAFSAIFIPQMGVNPEFAMTKNEASWIASVMTLATPVGSLVVGFIMDHFGRLRTLMMAAVPGVAGSVIIAVATNVPLLITGRILLGLSSALSSGPAIVYLTEIALKDMRGSLISIAPALVSLGMVLTFILGWCMTWRLVAWLNNIFIVVPFLLVFFIPESPAWLVSKNRIEEAKKSLIWINKYQPQPKNKTQTFSELQLTLLQREHELKMSEDTKRNKSGVRATINEFWKPTGYKPLIILTGLFIVQQFSGFYIFLFYSINFFQEVGSTYNPYFSSIFIGVVRFLMSLVNTWIQKKFKRRSLMLVSCFTMSGCIFLSGLFTFWIKSGTSSLTWVPVVLLLLYIVFAMIGMIPIPYPMTAEVFPLVIRGVAQSVSVCISSFVMFLALQFYPTLSELLGGICGVQYFFGGVALAGVVYVYIFLPETQGKKLSEIEEYFKHNTIYLGQKKKSETIHTDDKNETDNNLIKI